MFPKKYRIKKEKEFQTVFSRGKSIFDPICLLKYKRNNLLYSRFAVIVGKKVEKSAVKRHKWQRQILEILRLFPNLPQGYDLMFLVQKTAVNFSREEIKEHVEYLLKKIKSL